MGDLVRVSVVKGEFSKIKVKDTTNYGPCAGVLYVSVDHNSLILFQTSSQQRLGSLPAFLSRLHTERELITLVALKTNYLYDEVH